MWAAPLAMDAGLLAFVLVALIPVVGPGASFSPDEGVAVIQARTIQGDGGWIVEHPFAELDPGDDYYPLGASTVGRHGQAPFAKHPAYPVLLAGLDRAGGITAMVLLSIAGTVGAAVAAALLARRVAGGLERPVLWAVGLGSPLLFDAYLLIAHSLGAALAAGAVVAAAGGLQRGGARPFLLAALATAAAVLVRSEALVFAAALAAGIGLSAIALRRPRLLAGAAAVAGAGLAAALAEKQAQIALVGASPGGVQAPAVEGGFLGARMEAFINTWLDPSAGVTTSADLALLLAVVLTVAGAVVARRRPEQPGLLVAVVLVAGAVSVLAFADSPSRTVPGFLVAFPVAAVALALVDRRYFEAASGRLLVTVTAGLFVAAILATQYREGGSAEWGGRYFALAIPLVSVLAVDALARRSPALPVGSRRWAAAGLVGVSALLSVGAVTSLARIHSFTGELLERIAATGATSQPGDGHSQPVLVSAYPNIPRLAWASFSDQRWLHNPDPGAGAELAHRLREAGVDELVFVGSEPDDVAPYLVAYRVDEDRSWEMGSWAVSTLVPSETGGRAPVDSAGARLDRRSRRP